MAHSLSIVGDYTVNMTLVDGYMLGHYVPQEAKKNDRGEYQDVIETIELTLIGGGLVLAQNQKHTLDILFEQARLTQYNNVGKRVYLVCQINGEAEAWRSEILEGSVKLADDAWESITQNMVRVTLLIRRRYFWECNTRKSIYIGNTHGFGTSGVTIYPRDDSTHDNFVSIGVNVIEGSIPAPVEIRLKNNSGDDYDSRNWYISNNYYDVAADLQLEAEDSPGATVLPGSPDLTNYSGGKYVSFSGTTGTLQLQIPAGTVQAYSGKRAKVLLKMVAFSVSAGLSNIYVRASLRDYYGLVTLYSGNEVLLRTSDDYIQDLGNLPIPLGDYASDWESLTLVLEFRTADGGSESFGVDFVSLFPAEEGFYRHIEQRGMTLLNTSEIVDDGIERSLYFYEANRRHPILRGHGSPIFVYPFFAQRIHFLYDGVGSTLNWTYSVQLFYRPRRLTI